MGVKNPARERQKFLRKWRRGNKYRVEKLKKEGRY